MNVKQTNVEISIDPVHDRSTNGHPNVVHSFDSFVSKVPIKLHLKEYDHPELFWFLIQQELLEIKSKVQKSYVGERYNMHIFTTCSPRLHYLRELMLRGLDCRGLREKKVPTTKPICHQKKEINEILNQWSSENKVRSARTSESIGVTVRCSHRTPAVVPRSDGLASHAQRPLWTVNLPHFTPDYLHIYSLETMNKPQFQWWSFPLYSSSPLVPAFQRYLSSHCPSSIPLFIIAAYHQRKFERARRDEEDGQGQREVDEVGKATARKIREKGKLDVCTLLDHNLVFCVELRLSPKLPYFGFYKDEVVQSRLSLPRLIDKKFINMQSPPPVGEGTFLRNQNASFLREMGDEIHLKQFYLNGLELKDETSLGPDHWRQLLELNFTEQKGRGLHFSTPQNPPLSTLFYAKGFGNPLWLTAKAQIKKVTKINNNLWKKKMRKKERENDEVEKRTLLPRTPLEGRSGLLKEFPLQFLCSLHGLKSLKWIVFADACCEQFNKL
ncbi:hypothetical protein C0J52_23507 [Blattella germanica]|nr:hypothetical protein C0J52_23507 [Blattella germanica]